MSDNEDHLVSQAIAGDTLALSTLLEQYSQGLRAAVPIDQKWASVLDADDVLQVTFLEAFLRIGTFRPTGAGAFFGWVKRIAQNNLRDAVKELSRQKRPQPSQRVGGGSREESASMLLADLGITTTTPSRNAAGHEVRAALENALALLPADYAAVIRLYDLDGKPIEEVATETGKTRGAVHMLRSRAHDYLREILGAEARYFTSTGEPDRV